MSGGHCDAKISVREKADGDVPILFIAGKCIDGVYTPGGTMSTIAGIRMLSTARRFA